MAEQPYTETWPSKGQQGLNDIRKLLTTNTRRVSNIMRTLGPLMVSMENLVEISERFKIMLYEPQLLFKYRKDWIGFLWAIRLYNTSKSGSVRNNEAQSYLQQIILYDTELASNVEDVLSMTRKNFEIFSELFNELKKGRQYFVSYISTHAPELIEKAKAMKEKDTKLSKQLVDLFTAISGHEVDYLMQYQTDCEHWLNYALRDNIDFFINRIRLFLNGGFDSRSGAQFIGLYKDFEDEKIQGIVLRNKSVRNLGSYLNQLKYLGLLIGMCRRAYLSGDWNKGFFGPKGFWTDFEKYANDFERVYGNVDFKERLISTERKKEYELPQFWGGVWERSGIQDINALRQRGILYIVEGGVIYIIRKDGVLTKLLSELYSRRYQINKVIHPAAAALMKIFEERENGLKAAKNQKVQDLIKLLLSISGVPQLRKFRKLLRRKKKKLLRKLINDVSEWKSKSTDSLSQYQDISDEQERVLRKMTAEYIAQETAGLVARRNQEVLYADRQLATESFLKQDEDITELTLTGIAEKRAAEFQFRKIVHETLWHVTEEDFQYMQSLIPRIRDIIRRLTEVYEFIRSKMKQRYLIKAEALGMMEIDIEKRKNIRYELDYVREMLNRLI